jgi:hypothetical protein
VSATTVSGEVTVGAAVESAPRSTLSSSLEHDATAIATTTMTAAPRTTDGNLGRVMERILPRHGREAGVQRIP